ncbi:MAG: hypothetical protein II996_00720 [Oscillospiraceae bacterium]|nr:hypothetical protein [Oscillospiraceae bacterium]
MKGTREILRKLRELESRCPDDIEIIAEDFAGTQQRMTVKEFCKRENLGFVRIVSGDNTKDLDRIIEYLSMLGGEKGENT